MGGGLTGMYAEDSLRERLHKANRKFRIAALICSVLVLVLGVFLVIRPADSLLIVGRVIGIGLLCVGLYNAVLCLTTAYASSLGVFNAFRGIFSICMLSLGIAVITHPEIVPMFAGYVLAVIFAVSGIQRLSYVNLQRSVNDPKWIGCLLGGILSLGFAAAFIFAPFSSQAAMMRMAGVALVFVSLWGLIYDIRALVYGFKNNGESG